MHEPWTLEPDEVVSLPVDDLALRVLKDAHVNEEWNWRNWMNSARKGYKDRPDAQQALSEAWAWLINRGLIVWNPAQGSESAFVISRRGSQLLALGLPWIRAVERLDVELTPILEAKARPQFLRGDLEAAVFMALKEVEVAVRTKAGLPSTLIGTALMQEAFKPPKNLEDPSTAGPLWQAAIHPGEAVAMMELFKGAIGLFKNPVSHRAVNIEDPTEAAETVLLADLLLRLLDKIEVVSIAVPTLASRQEST